jgi:hypothetical protein
VSLHTLPRRYFRPVGYRKDGRPIFPIAGGSAPPDQQTGDKDQQQQTGDKDQQQQSGPPMAKDDDGKDLYPLNTAIADMTPDQRANYWRSTSKNIQKNKDAEIAELKRQLAAVSGTVTGQQTQSAQQDDQAVQAQIAEARREGQRDAVVISLTTSLQMRERTREEIDELLGVVDPNKFLDDSGKVDSTKVANYISRVAPVGTSGGSNGAPGQGRFENREKADPRAQARAEAERRGHINPANNRGALGGLRK